MEKLESSFIAERNVNGKAVLENSSPLTGLNINLVCDLAIPLLRIRPKEMKICVYTKKSYPKVTAAAFKIAKGRNNPNKDYLLKN